MGPRGVAKTVNLHAFTVVWLLTAVVASIYMVHNLRRAHGTMNRVAALPDQPAQQFFAARRMERQATVLAVELFRFAEGSMARRD